MAIRTYIPQLRILLAAIKLYMNRWQVKLQENLTTQQYQCLVAVIEAVDLCLIALGPQEVNP